MTLTHDLRVPVQTATETPTFLLLANPFLRPHERTDGDRQGGLGVRLFPFPSLLHTARRGGEDLVCVEFAVANLVRHEKQRPLKLRHETRSAKRSANSRHGEIHRQKTPSGMLDSTRKAETLSRQLAPPRGSRGVGPHSCGYMRGPPSTVAIYRVRLVSSHRLVEVDLLHRLR